jgi:NADP-dependent 3-hydroxy acid dehydrogenase YdfG
MQTRRNYPVFSGTNAFERTERDRRYSSLQSCLAVSDHALRGRAGLVTGASSGIGRAIALTLATEGVALALVGRDKARLVDIAQEARAAGAPMVTPLLVDLADEVRVRAAAATVAHMVDKLDLLVHSAGAYERRAVAEASVEALDRQYHANLRGPYLPTQLLLPRLRARGGDIIFVNSTQGIAASPNVGAYAATQHGMKALADSLRAEVNCDRVRVLV